MAHKPGLTDKPSLSKNHQNYWRTRLHRKTVKRPSGEIYETADFHVRIQFCGRREEFNLKTPNKIAASLTARKIYASLVANGWEPTLREFKPETEKRIVSPNVGQLIEAVRQTSGIRPATVEMYAQRLRTMAAEIVGIESDHSKHDYRKGGQRVWRSKVEGVKLSRLTPEKIQAWKLKRLKEAGTNPLEIRKAKVNVNSMIRGGKSLFSKKALKFADLELPSPLPFEGVDFECVPKHHTRYRSEFNPTELLDAATRELKDSEPEQFKILLLALGAGLRRGEIDRLTWRQIDFDQACIRVEANDYGELKSGDSEAEVDVDPTMLDLLNCLPRDPSEEFVIKHSVVPRPGVTYRHYRCYTLFRKLTKWLREHGVDTNAPIHTLRKEFGSILCEQAGIFAASAQLRHSDIRITRDHYLAKREKVTVKIGEMLPKARDELK